MRHPFLDALATGAAGFLLLTAPASAQQRGINVLEYRFALTLPESGPRIEVAERLRAIRAAGTSELALDLLPPMQVSEARLGCGDATTVTSFTHEGARVRVVLSVFAAPATLDPGAPPGADTVCVSLRYAGEPKDGLIISTDSAGRWRAFGDNWPDRGRHWLASVDHPSDKALVEFVVDAPSPLRVIANGTQRASAPSGAGRTRTTWATTLPIPTYLMVIAAAPLVEHDLGQTACGHGAIARCVPQQVYTAPEQARFMPGHFAESDSIVTWLARAVGPFPYEKLAHLQSSTRFGGMENAGAIFYADRLFRTQDGLGVGLIAHETAHQWFGDAVTEREWGHVWLSEGFATYFAALYTEHSRGDSAFGDEMSRIRDQVFAAKVVSERSVIDTAQTDLLALLNTNSYQKGGFVLHMLRRQVGDSAFFRGVRAYYAEFKHSNAMTRQFQTAIERTTGQDLTWFFDQWLRKPGWADVTLTWAYDATTSQVVITTQQRGPFGAYRLRVPVEVEAADGTRTMTTAEIPALSNGTARLQSRLPSAPKALRFDPAGELLARFHAP